MKTDRKPSLLSKCGLAAEKAEYHGLTGLRTKYSTKLHMQQRIISEDTGPLTERSQTTNSRDSVLYQSHSELLLSELGGRNQILKVEEVCFIRNIDRGKCKNLSLQPC